MKLLEEIPLFPQPVRRTLESRYGIETAEAFYANAVRNPQGMREALNVDQPELDRLTAIVEGYLPAGEAERHRRPAAKHPRGVIWKD